MSIKKTDVLGNLVYAAVSMSCASEIPGYNGSLFAISDDIKERIESDLTEARAAVEELIEASKQLSGTYGWHWDRDDGSLVIFPDRVDDFDDRMERLRIALANIGETK